MVDAPHRPVGVNDEGIDPAIAAARGSDRADWRLHYSYDPRGGRTTDCQLTTAREGEHLRRVVTSQELTVDAALSGDRAKVLEAMFADPMAGALPFEHVVAMTDELLAATSPWLAQFSERS